MALVCLLVILTLDSHIGPRALEAHFEHIITFLLHPRKFVSIIISFAFFNQ